MPIELTPEHSEVLMKLNLQLQRQVSRCEISYMEAERLYTDYCMEKDLNKLKGYLK